MFIEQKELLNDELILIDGYWGSGKSLLFSLIDDQEYYIKSVIDEPIEHCLALNLLGELSDDGLKTFLIMRSQEMSILGLTTTLDQKIYLNL